MTGKQEIMEIHQATDVKNKIELLKTKIHTHIYISKYNPRRQDISR